MDLGEYTNQFEDNYYTKNRKLKIEEYNDNGDVIDTIDFSQKELWEFYIFKNNSCNKFELARKKDRDYFKGKKLELVKNMIYLFKDFYFDENIIKKMELIFETYTVEEIEFALDFKNYIYGETDNYFIWEDYFKIKEMNFMDVLIWIKNTEGMYYAVENDGVKGMHYLEKPTKKQAKYQRQKNGKRIVFLNFRDWKEYLVNESEL